MVPLHPARVTKRCEELLARRVEALLSRLDRIIVVETIKLDIGTAATRAHLDAIQVLLRFRELHFLVPIGMQFAEREELVLVLTIRAQTLHTNLVSFVVVLIQILRWFLAAFRTPIYESRSFGHIHVRVQ